MRVFILFVFLLVNISFSQVKGTLRLNFDIGKVVSSKESRNFAAYLEPKYNLTDNLNIGLRTGVALVYREPKFDQNINFSTSASSSTSFILTIDYYPKLNSKYIKPFVGFGVGFYTIDKLGIDFKGDTAIDVIKNGLSPFGDIVGNINNIDINSILNTFNNLADLPNDLLVNNSISVDSRTKFGYLLKTGIESGRFRLGVDYNHVPNSVLSNTAGKAIGKANNSYFGLHLGFFIGGRGK